MRDRFDESFDVFFRQRHAAMVAVALAMLGDVETARDVVQEGMLRASQRWDRVHTLDRPDMWVRRVVVNLCIDAQRRRGRESRVHAADHRDQVAAVDEHVEQTEVWQAVRALPARQRTAIVLRYVEDLTVPDIATVLGVAEGTIKATLAHARAALADRLAATPEVRES